jgi:hypothetical protein
MISSQHTFDDYQVTSFPVTFDEFATIGLVIAALGIIIAIVVPWLIRRDARARHRLELLGESLKNQQLDAQTRSQILSVLAKEHNEGRLRFLKDPGFWQRCTFGFGWLVFIGSLGVSLLLWLSDDPDAENGLFFAVGGLAIFSLPIAMRELAAFKSRNTSRDDAVE